MSDHPAGHAARPTPPHPSIIPDQDFFSGKCASSSSGAKETRAGEEVDGGTERQAHGSQPVQVRSGETPGSPVARLPASGESPPSKRSDKAPARGRATGRSAASSEACGVVTEARVSGTKREPSRHFTRRRPRTAPESLERVPKNPPAYGAWNGQKGVVGTGESLLGPGGLRVAGSWLAYNRRPPGSGGRPRGSRRGS